LFFLPEFEGRMRCRLMLMFGAEKDEHQKDHKQTFGQQGWAWALQLQAPHINRKVHDALGGHTSCPKPNATTQSLQHRT
jgi:hypothetical protein